MIALVVRPQPQANQLAEMLRQVGHQPIVVPLLKTEAGDGLKTLSQNLTWADVIIAVSRSAVIKANDYLCSQNLSWPNKSYFAVGAATARAFTEIGLTVIHPDLASSEGLLSLPLLSAQCVSAKRVLILRGDGGRELLSQTLTERGAWVNYCETYRRCPITIDGLTQVKEWQQQGLTTLLISSGSLLVQLLQQIPSAYHDWLKGLNMIVPSQRLAVVAQELGFSMITTANSASSEDFLAALELRMNQ